MRSMIFALGSGKEAPTRSLFTYWLSRILSPQSSVHLGNQATSIPDPEMEESVPYGLVQRNIRNTPKHFGPEFLIGSFAKRAPRSSASKPPLVTCHKLQTVSESSLTADKVPKTGEIAACALANTWNRYDWLSRQLPRRKLFNTGKYARMVYAQLPHRLYEYRSMVNLVQYHSLPQ